MIRKFKFGMPFETDAVVAPVPLCEGVPEGVTVTPEGAFTYTCHLAPGMPVYGLGENVRGMNKRGWHYVSFCTDEAIHSEEKVSLYSAQNFLLLAGETPRGLFFDYPGRMEFDVGYTELNTLTVTCGDANLYLYILEGDSPDAVVHAFRQIIGKSYIPPKFGFGFCQSRWSYETADEVRDLVRRYREKHIPLDSVCLDIDYMERYKDFTVDEKKFPDFPAFVQELRDEHVRLVPIIDAGVKVEAGYEPYEEGVKQGYFCTGEDGQPFEAAVWSGYTHFPDVLNPEARAWFGGQYRKLLDAGIEGFWNDMNEPAIFYTHESAEQCRRAVQRVQEDEGRISTIMYELMGARGNDNYTQFYHETPQGRVRHDKVHNLFGYNMTRSAGEAFQKYSPDKRILMYSRASYVGMHRYGGTWMGDNKSWWSHLLLNLSMLPSLNMCGFLYTGADLGGFGDDTTRDLLLRWLALGVFTPLMRDHSARGTRRQELDAFGDTADFKFLLSVRYRLIPFLYSEFLKAAQDDTMMFRPLSFQYPGDAVACQTEDQLLIGDTAMIAPVYKQNAQGRMVWLPEEMLFVRFAPDGIQTEMLPKGAHYVTVALNEVPLFLRPGKGVPLAAPAESTDELNWEELTLLGTPGSTYRLRREDGSETCLTL